MSTRFIATLGLVVIIGGCAATAETGAPSSGAEDTADLCPTEGEPMAEAKLYIEHNATDADTGVHGLFGGDGWAVFCLRSPSGEMLLAVTPDGPLGELGLADLFFESREPPNDEYPIDNLLGQFPEGTYEASAVDVDGVSWTGSARFTSVIPAAPVITSPALSDDEDRVDAFVNAGELTVSWEPVTESLESDDVTITGYEVIVTSIDDVDADGASVPVFDIHLPSTTTSVAVPDGFLRSGATYELEVLAVESSGNQAIALGFFAVR